ncbi:MAG: prolipoprotein diacylglyceryl transferase [Balneolaceae bacterium]
MLPIHLDLGFNQIYFYEGIYFLISIVLAVWWGQKRVKKFGGHVEKFEGLVLWAIVWALIGARVSHYMFWESDAFWADPTIILSLTGAGNSITGGLVGGMFGGWLYMRRNKMNYWEYFSILSPVVLLGQGLGRIGCFLNGDAYGKATSSFLGVQFPRYGTVIPSFETEYRISSPAWQYSFENGLVDQSSTVSAALHATQLYEMLGDFILIGIVLWVFNKYFQKDKKSPIIFFIHTGGYALLRFALEFLRADNEAPAMFNMTSLQIVLLLYGIFTTVYALRYFASKNKSPAHG